MTQESPRFRRDIFLNFAAALFGVGMVIAAVLSFRIVLPFFELQSSAMAHEVGDAYNILNALFAGLAFVGLLFAIHLQRQELILQRKELTLQRKELELTRVELHKSAEAQDRLWKITSDRFTRDKDWSLTQVSLGLVREWHSAEMYRARMDVTELWDRHNKGEEFLPWLNVVATNREPRFMSLFRVLQFFEQVALLSKKELLDRQLIDEGLGPYFQFYGQTVRFLRKGEEHAAFEGRLAFIDRVLLAPVDGRRFYE